jgi:ABC-type glycerol-3-phosphate transport system substrate-binding protein
MSGYTVTRRSLLKGLAAGAGALLLGACTPKATPTPVVQIIRETAVPAAAGPIIVTQFVNANIFAEADSFTEAQAWTVVMPKFNKEQKDIVLRYEPVSQGEFVTKVAAMTAAKELGNSLLWLSGKPLGDFAREKLIMPLDDLAKAQGVDVAAIYDERALAVLRYDTSVNQLTKGPLWGLPMTINPGVSLHIFNASMFEKAGVGLPQETWTYDDLLAAAKKIAKPNEGVWGYQHIRGGGGAPGNHGISNDYSYIAPWGGYIFDRAGKKAMVNTPESMEAWNWIYDAIHVHKVSPTPDDAKAFGDYKQAHMASKLALYKEGPWGAMHFRLIPGEGKPGYVKAGEIPALKGKSGRPGNTLSADGWAISTNATAPAACLKALVFMTGLEAGLQRNFGAFSAGATKAFFTHEPALKDPYLVNTIKAAAAAELPYIPANGRAAEVDDILKQRLVLLDGGSQKVTQAFFDQLNADIQTILDKPPA